MNQKDSIVAILSSSLFYFWYTLLSNGRDLSKDIYLSFPIDLNQLSPTFKNELDRIGRIFVNDLEANKKRVIYNKSSGTVIYDQYWVHKSKPIIDEIDKVLAKHYGFTEEELDFIINYDIKYRMGDELEAQ